MLSEKVKEQMKSKRIEQYQMKIFELQMDMAALQAIDDEAGCKQTQERIEAIEKAIEAVRVM